MYRILIVDDEEKLRKAIVKYAQFQGYEAVEAADGEEAVELCRGQSFDLILLDVMMPKMDGIVACRQIRKICDTPIIMLTAKGEEYDRIIGFESGADDYVVKPFSPKELMLRMGAMLKRSKKPDRTKQPPLVAGRITLSLSGHWLEVDGVRAELTTKELDLLAYLVSRPGEVIPRQELCSVVWGSADQSVSRTLDTHIKQLRKALSPCGNYITTFYGLGYRFEVQ